MTFSVGLKRHIVLIVIVVEPVVGVVIHKTSIGVGRWDTGNHFFLRNSLLLNHLFFSFLYFYQIYLYLSVIVVFVFLAGIDNLSLQQNYSPVYVRMD